MTRRPTARPTTRRATAGATRDETRRDETRRDETRRVDDRTTRGRRVPRRWSRLVSSIQIRFKFDSNSIQIRFVTARPTATDSDDGPPPPPPRAGDDGRRSTSRRERYRIEVVESNRTNERTIARASTSLSRRDAMTRCDVKGARRVPSALLEAVRFSPTARARACMHRIRVPQRRARAEGAHTRARR